jgi:hypothetical protein
MTFKNSGSLFQLAKCKIQEEYLENKQNAMISRNICKDVLVHSPSKCMRIVDYVTGSVPDWESISKVLPNMVSNNQNELSYGYNNKNKVVIRKPCSKSQNKIKEVQQ